MKIHVITAEHFSVPGFILKAFVRRKDAVTEAIELVNIMLKDNGWQPLASVVQWEHHLSRLQEEHGAAHCYVEITELDVVGAEQLPGLIETAVYSWPQFDAESGPIEPGPISDEVDSYVNGGDLVEWFGEWREQAKALLVKAEG